MKKLGHDSADDDDRLLTFGSKSFCKGLAGWIVSHGAHGWIEERFAKPRRAVLAHRCVR